MKPPEPLAPQSHGFVSNSMAWVASALKYGRALASLAGIEAREAGLYYGIVIATFVVALILGLIGYVFLIVAAVFGVVQALGPGASWITVMAGAAVLHILVAAILGIIAGKRLKAGAFPLTIMELKKDQLWLTNLANKH